MGGCESNMWTGDTCTTAVCTDGCGNGYCIAPNICRCPPLNTVITTKGSGGAITKVECESQRLSGLKTGFLPTLAVLFGSIVILKVLGKLYEKKHGPRQTSSKYSVSE